MKVGALLLVLLGLMTSAGPVVSSTDLSETVPSSPIDTVQSNATFTSGGARGTIGLPTSTLTQSDARIPPGIAPLFEVTPEGKRIAAQARENGNAENLRQQHLQTLRQAARQCADSGRASGESAAEQTWVLGLLTLHGYAGLPDKTAAEVLFRTSWACGYPLATAGLAWCAMTGCSARPAQAQALRWTEHLLRANAGRALYLRWLIASGSHLPGLTPAAQTTGRPAAVGVTAGADGLLRQAAELGDVQALNEMGMQLAAAGQLEGALEVFVRASGSSIAAGNNARAIKQQIAIKATLQRWSSTPLPGEYALSAGRVDTQTADAAESLFQMAQRFHRGEGVAVNYPAAIRWYRAALAAGSSKAARILEQIYSRTDPAMGLNAEWMAQLAAMPQPGERRLTGADRTVASSVAGGLHRDETPLVDLIPPAWRP